MHKILKELDNGNIIDDTKQTDGKNIGSGNDLVPSGNKALPEPMLTQIYVTIWRH